MARWATNRTFRKERSADRGEVNFGCLSLKTSVRYMQVEGAQCTTILPRHARQTLHGHSKATTKTASHRDALY